MELQLAVPILILIAAFIKAIADTIRVPEKFNSSVFKKYKGHNFIDPQVSWRNQHNLQWWCYPFLVHFSDLWHFCNTVIWSLLFACILIGKPFCFEIQSLDNFQNTFLNFMLYWVIYGIGIESGLKLISKKK